MQTRRIPSRRAWTIQRLSLPSWEETFHGSWWGACWYRSSSCHWRITWRIASEWRRQGGPRGRERQRRREELSEDKERGRWTWAIGGSVTKTSRRRRSQRPSTRGKWPNLKRTCRRWESNSAFSIPSPSHQSKPAVTNRIRSADVNVEHVRWKKQDGQNLQGENKPAPVMRKKEKWNKKTEKQYSTTKQTQSKLSTQHHYEEETKSINEIEHIRLEEDHGKVRWPLTVNKKTPCPQIIVDQRELVY